MFRTILPNSWSPILVQVVILAAVAILLEAALAFLGVGIPPPTPSWGEMLRTGKSYLYEAPYYAVLPGLVLTLTILSLDTLGRTLATVLEDRQRRPARRTASGRQEAAVVTGYILRRLAQLLPVTLLASLAIWAMIYAVPGGPIGAMVGENATPEQIQAATRAARPRSAGARAIRAPGSATRCKGDLGLSLQNRATGDGADPGSACRRRCSSASPPS